MGYKERMQHEVGFLKSVNVSDKKALNEAIERVGCLQTRRTGRTTVAVDNTIQRVLYGLPVGISRDASSESRHFVRVLETRLAREHLLYGAEMGEMLRHQHKTREFDPEGSRLIDQAIQNFFEQGAAVLSYGDDRPWPASQVAVFLHRLTAEHGVGLRHTMEPVGGLDVCRWLDFSDYRAARTMLTDEMKRLMNLKTNLFALPK